MPDSPRSLRKRLRRQLGRIKWTVLRQHVVQPVYPVPASQCGGPLSDEKMTKIYSRSKINLGFSKAGDTHLMETSIKQMCLRDFEVPMSGGFIGSHVVRCLTEREVPVRVFDCNGMQVKKNLAGVDGVELVCGDVFNHGKIETRLKGIT